MLTMSSEIQVWKRSAETEQRRRLNEEQQEGCQQEWGRRGKMAMLQVLHLPVCDDVV